jgi:hypothetical protein
MRKSVARRGIVFAVASVITAGGLAVVAAPASAHDVTAIDASCAFVTVHFARFPTAGVPVTIVVQVANKPAITTVDSVDSSTADETVDISSLTSQQ